MESNQNVESKQKSVESKNKQESWAIAKTTVRCTLYMAALKICGRLWICPRLLYPKFTSQIRFLSRKRPPASGGSHTEALPLDRTGGLPSPRPSVW